MRPLNILSTLCLTLSLLSSVGQAQATLKNPLMTIDLETPVHFLAPDGSDVLVEPGAYSVEPVAEWLRVMPVGRHDAFLIGANKGTHELELEQAIAMSMPGELDNEKDTHYVMLLLPDGKTLEATGTYSGIRPRGLFSRTFSRIQRATSQTGTSAKQWNKLSQVASAAAATEARNWLRQAYIDSRLCRVWGPAATGRPGVLKSRYSFQGKISKALQAAGASQSIAQGWDKAFKESWENWAKDISIPALPFYPPFAAWPGPTAPPLANIPHPLGALYSRGFPGMDPNAIYKKVLAKLGTGANSPTARVAVKMFGDDIGSRFGLCMTACSVQEVMGSGSFPSYSFPLLPIGAIYNGTCTGGKVTVRGF